jgi:hypothetical protein
VDTTGNVLKEDKVLVGAKAENSPDNRSLIHVQSQSRHPDLSMNDRERRVDPGVGPLHPDKGHAEERMTVTEAVADPSLRPLKESGLLTKQTYCEE